MKQHDVKNPGYQKNQGKRTEQKSPADQHVLMMGMPTLNKSTLLTTHRGRGKKKTSGRVKKIIGGFGLTPKKKTPECPRANFCQGRHGISIPEIGRYLIPRGTKTMALESTSP
jgi:hypothetical protein